MIEMKAKLMRVRLSGVGLNVMLSMKSFRKYAHTNSTIHAQKRKSESVGVWLIIKKQSGKRSGIKREGCVFENAIIFFILKLLSF